MSFDVSLYGDGLRFEVDWARDGMFAHPFSDVTNAWWRAHYEYGSARRSNPQRPTVLAGRGRLSLIGEEFVPGRSTVFTEEELRMRYMIRVTYFSVLLFTAFMADIRHEPNLARGGTVVSWRLEGQLEQQGRTRQVVEQAAADAAADDVAVLDLLREAYGLDAADLTSSIQPTELGQYNFSGAAAQYASQFALVAGALPTAGPDGDLSLVDPNIRPATYPTFRMTDYTILDAASEFDIEQLRNWAEIEFAPVTVVARKEVRLNWLRYPTVAQRTGFQNHTTLNVEPPDILPDFEFISNWDSARTSGVLNWNQFNIDLPTAEPGFTYSDVRVEDVTLEALVKVRRIAVFSLNSYQLGDLGYIDDYSTTMGENIADYVTATLTSPTGGVDAIDVDVDGDIWRDRTWEWDRLDDGVAQTATNWYTQDAARTAGTTLLGFRLTYAIRYTINPPAGETVVVDQPDTVHTVDDTTATISLDLPALTDLGEYNSVSLAALDVEQLVTQVRTTTRCVETATPWQYVGFDYSSGAAAIAAAQAALAADPSGVPNSADAGIYTPPNTWYARYQRSVCARYETFTHQSQVWVRDATRSTAAEANSTIALNDAQGGADAVTLTFDTTPDIPAAGDWRVVVGLETEQTRPASERSKVVIRDDNSIDVYERREVDFPPWFRFGVYQRAVDRIAVLSQPRNVFTPKFAMSQPDVTRSAEVARVRPGDHIGLSIDDPASRVDINAVAYVMLAKYNLDRNRDLSKELVCLQSGDSTIVAHTPPVLAISDVPLAINGVTLRV